MLKVLLSRNRKILISYQYVLASFSSNKNYRMESILEMKARPISTVFEIENKLKDKMSLILAIEMSNKTGKHEEISNILKDQRITLSKMRRSIKCSLTPLVRFSYHGQQEDVNDDERDAGGDGD